MINLDKNIRRYHCKYDSLHDWKKRWIWSKIMDVAMEFIDDQKMPEEDVLEAVVEAAESLANVQYGIEDHLTSDDTLVIIQPESENENVDDI